MVFMLVYAVRGSAIHKNPALGKTEVSFVTFLSIFLNILCDHSHVLSVKEDMSDTLEYTYTHPDWSTLYTSTCMHTCLYVYPLLTTKHERLVHILQCCKLSTHSVCLRTPAVWEELYTICLCSVYSLTSTFVVWITPNCGQRRCRFQKDIFSKVILVQGLQHCLKFWSCMLWESPHLRSTPLVYHILLVLLF